MNRGGQLRVVRAAKQVTFGLTAVRLLLRLVGGQLHPYA
jgi:hypothetical protein